MTEVGVENCATVTEADPAIQDQLSGIVPAPEQADTLSAPEVVPPELTGRKIIPLDADVVKAFHARNQDEPTHTLEIICDKKLFINGQPYKFKVPEDPEVHIATLMMLNALLVNGVYYGGRGMYVAEMRQIIRGRADSKHVETSFKRLITHGLCVFWQDGDKKVYGLPPDLKIIDRRQELQTTLSGSPQSAQQQRSPTRAQQAKMVFGHEETHEAPTTNRRADLTALTEPQHALALYIIAGSAYQGDGLTRRDYRRALSACAGTKELASPHAKKRYEEIALWVASMGREPMQDGQVKVKPGMPADTSKMVNFSIEPFKPSDGACTVSFNQDPDGLRWMLDTFYSTKKEDVRVARAYCAGCPVLQACLDHALGHDEESGTRGGLTHIQREEVLELSNGGKDQRERAAIIQKMWQEAGIQAIYVPVPDQAESKQDIPA